ncbi:hypothetical protein RUM44_009935 [Polyplax serrata]|uniref:Chitin-binding type-4 domain-containing protein n=1 Tax=Polyplax serrata TaxID=468196 RepID=A0ABR1AVL2_POLSC
MGLKQVTMGRWLVFSFLPIFAIIYRPVEGHGRLIEPPSRATMWRYGFDTPPNYNDHELYCGGYSRQWQSNGGKCGICGDAWDLPKPRPHEAGGKYGNGIIVRKYKKGSMINVRVELTANHKGYFEFRLCPNNAPHKVGTQECLDLNVLKLAKKSTGGTYGDEPAMAHDTRYYPASGSKVFEMRYNLPKNLTCSQCILQWRYIAGNNWGMCANGTGLVGCGPQEEFRACADVAIVDSAGEADETPYIPNEIEKEVSKDLESGKKPEEDHSELWFLLREAVKEWWEQKHLPMFHKNPQETQFWKTFKAEGNRFVPWRTGDTDPVKKEKNYAIPQPVPPPRTKRGNKDPEEREN